MIACLLLSTPVDPLLLLPLLANFSPAVEAVGATFFIDLGNLADQRPADLLDQLNQAVSPTLAQPPCLGLAVGKFPAQLAAASLGPGRGLVIVPDCEADFLRPLPINLLPLDQELSRQFRLLGLDTLGQLADLPTGAILNRFGRSGRWLQQLARGQDDRPVRPFQIPPVEQITHTLESPITNLVILQELLHQLLAVLTTRLRAAYQICRTVQLTLTLTDGVALQEIVSLRQSTQQASSIELAVQARLTRLNLFPGVSQVTIILANLGPALGEQPELFGPTPSRLQSEALQSHLPELLARFGPERFYTVELTTPNAHLPERRFRLHPAERE